MKTPSQPSPFSAELQTFIITKYEPLLTIIQELSSKVETLEKDKFYLEKRIENLEKNQSFAIAKAENIAPDQEGIKEGLAQNKYHAALTPWLFSAKNNTAVSSIQLLLEYSIGNTMIIDCRDLRRENDLWLQIFERTPHHIGIEKPTGTRLYELRNAARKFLLDLCKTEILIILKNVPNKNEIDEMRSQVTLMAVLIASIAEAWERMQDIARVELGRVAIVLMGNSVGQRIRAGQQVFDISPLN